jgi:hypothetical protein
MADSDNSRTLPPVTRGDFHSFVAETLSVVPEHGASTSVSQDACDADPAFASWRTWYMARKHALDCCWHQQQLETKLFAVFHTAFPPDEASVAIDNDAEYAEALAAEERAFEAEQATAETLWSTPAQSLAGATAKLHAILSKGRYSVSCDEYPWPQIRLVLIDLLNIDANLSMSRDELQHPAAPETRGEDRTKRRYG